MNRNAREILITHQKAQLVDSDNDVYAAVRKDGVLCWYDKDGTERVPVALHVAFRQDWQPYPEVKEIRPEKAGELWRYTGQFPTNYLMISGRAGYRLVPDQQKLSFIDCALRKDIAHGKNGWTRIWPIVEEKESDASLWGKSTKMAMDSMLEVELRKNKEFRSLLDIIKSDLKRKENEVDKVYGKSIPFIMDEEKSSIAREMLNAVKPIFELPDRPTMGDDSIKRIEIDHVEWIEDDGIVYPRGGFKDWKTLPGRLPMKMILEFQKEECSDTVKSNSVERVEIEPEIIAPNGDHGKSVYKFRLPDGYVMRVHGKPLILEIPKVEILKEVDESQD